MKQSSTLTPTVVRTPLELDEFVQSYEEARAVASDAKLADFLPRNEHPLYLDVLRELIRVDLEFAWRDGQAKRLEDYGAEFPELFDDQAALRDTAFEEYRLRLQAGENPSPAEYARRFGIDTEGWPGDVESHNAGLAFSLMNRAASAYQQFRQDGDESVAALDAWCASVGGNNACAELFHAVHQTDPLTAVRLAQSVLTFPKIGEYFLGFYLLEELGRGAFGTVYLAEQGDLANRPVALKVATNILGESQTLAQLQHTHIVPIYSVHRADVFQAVCMPYFGRTTLADVLRQLNDGRTIPASGKVLVSTLNDRKSSTRQPGSRRISQPATLPATEYPGPEAPSEKSAKDADAAVVLQKLESMSYVNAVLWIGARLADGLAHAHERGILHRDLKPANILLTDDGQPMLLDFNLSEDTKLRGSAVAASIGGTLPYMSPEHLEAFRRGTKALDARSDIYSLGVILHELLTGQRPFPTFPGASHVVLDQMIEDRRKPLPAMRPLNPAVTPAVEAIIHRCLQPDPAKRYDAARDLYEDLDHQLNNLPLRHTAEPSLRERAGKFARRHPRLTSVASVAVLSAALCLTLIAAFAMQATRMRRLEAREQQGAFQQDASRAHHILYARMQSPEELKEGVELCRAALDRYQVLDNPRWQELPAVQYLSKPDQEKLQEDAGELLFLLARGTEREALDQSQPAKRNEQLQLAMGFNDLAETRSHGVLGSAPLWEQRAHLARLLGDKAESDRLLRKVREMPAESTRDLYLTAHGYAIDGNFRAAMPILQTVTRRDPRNYSAWAVLGNCHDELCQEADALACYTACIALRPDDPRAWHIRGLIYLRQRLFESARADFDEAIRLRNDFADAYTDRALAKQGLNNYAGAIEDLSAALKLGTARTRVYFMRAFARAKSGDQVGAKRDTEDGLRLEPADAKSWIARGLARQARDPKGALSDYDKALEMNPRSVDALQDKAHVLSELLGRRDDAIRVLDRAVEIYPDFVPARAGRGVLLARDGKCQLAEADAREALLRDTRAPNLYQVAGIYALNSKAKPEDRLQALHLLAQALRRGFGLDLVDQDSDLDPIRNDPEFSRVVKAARELRK